MKKLKILLVVLIGLIICLLILHSILVRRGQVPVEQKPEIDQNVAEVHNQGGDFLEYNGFIYFVNKYREKDYYECKLCRRNMETMQEQVLLDLEQYSTDGQLIIYGNKVFFSMMNQTLWFDIGNGNTREDFNQGVLHYMTDHEVYYTYNGRLYVSEYFPATFMIKSVNSLVSGNNRYIGEYNGYLFFYSTDSINNIKVYTVNIKDNKVNVIDNIASSDGLGNLKKGLITKTGVYMLFDGFGKKQTVKKYSFDKQTSDIIYAKEGIQNIYVYKEDCYFDFGKDNVSVYVNKEGGIRKANFSSNTLHIYWLENEEEGVMLYRSDGAYIKLMDKVEGTLSDKVIEEIEGKVYLSFNVKDDNNTIVSNGFYQVDLENKTTKVLNDTFKKAVKVETTTDSGDSKTIENEEGGTNNEE